MTASTLYERGIDYGNAGRHAAARRALDTALLRSTDVDLTARITGIIAYLDSETGDADGAITRLEVTLATHGLTAHTRAILAGQLGLIAMYRGDSASALPRLGEAIAALTDDPARLGRAHLNRGLVYLQQGDATSAETDFAAASVAFARSGEPIAQARTRHNQGYAALLRGDVIVALRLMDEARPALATLSPVALATCDQDRAEVLLAAGMSTEATGLLSNVVAVYGSRRLRRAQAEAELVVARTLVYSDAAAAGVVARRAARRFRTQGSEAWAARADALAMTAAVLAGRHGSALIAQAARIVENLDARELAADALIMRIQLARLEVRSGALAEARGVFASAHVSSITPITTRLLAFEVDAELCAATGDSGGVLDRARDGLDALQDWQASLGSIELQSTLAFHSRQLIGHGIRAALADGRPETVFEWSERTRSLVSRIVPLRPPANAELAADLTELRQLRRTEPAAGSPQAHRERELSSRIRSRQWTDEGSGTVTLLSTLDRVSAELATSGAVLVAYLWSDERLVALVVSGNETRVVQLGSWAPIRQLLDGLLADLDMTAAELAADLRHAVRASLDARLTQLSQVLIEPLRLSPDDGRVVVTPAAALAGIPWQLLPGLTDRSITIPTSATRWLQQRTSPFTLATAGFAAGPRVLRAEQEVTEAASVWVGARILCREEATSGRVAALAEQVDVLHIAAHGRHAADNPLFSGIELADGPWFGYDIDTIERVPAVVVLSACELGRSAVRWGEEALGMAQSWLHAGARCVIAAPASVNDAVAHEVLTAAHGLLAAGIAPADALAAASLRTATTSGFQCYGAGW